MIRTKKHTIKHTIKSGECRTIACLPRQRHHHLVHKIHKKHKIPYKTLFYMKEYGPKSHVSWVIIKESLKILILASLISSLGGASIQSVQESIALMMPLLIMLPALANMIGSFGTIISSKFTTMLFLGRVRGNWQKSRDLQELIATMSGVALIAAVYTGVLSYAAAMLKGFEFSALLFVKIIGVSVMATFLLVAIIFALSIAGGLWVFRKGEDPNNFLIPMTTSVADVGSLFLLTVLIRLFF